MEQMYEYKEEEEEEPQDGKVPRRELVKEALTMIMKGAFWIKIVRRHAARKEL